MFYKSIHFLLVILFISKLVYSQESNKEINSSGGGKGFFMFGWIKSDLNDLNARLVKSNYPELSKNQFSFGGGGFGKINRIMIGGQGHGFSSNIITKGNYNLKYSGGYGLFDLGYVFFSLSGVDIFSMIGFGGGGILIDIYENKPIRFDEILDNPKRGVQLSSAGFLINFSFGLDYLINLSDQSNDRGGIALGLRLGYLFSPYMSDWKISEEVDALNGPKPNMNGFYLHFMIGGGGTGRN